jgi:hypothetical protein
MQSKKDRSQEHDLKELGDAEIGRNKLRVTGQEKCVVKDQDKQIEGPI